MDSASYTHEMSTNGVAYCIKFILYIVFTRLLYINFYNQFNFVNYLCICRILDIDFGQCLYNITLAYHYEKLHSNIIMINWVIDKQVNNNNNLKQRKKI